MNKKNIYKIINNKYFKYISLLIISLLFILLPTISMTIIAYLLSGFIIFIGIYTIYKKEKQINKISLIISIFSIFLGIIMFIIIKAVINFIPILVGIYLFIEFLIQLFNYFYSKNKNDYPWSYLLISILYLISGILFFINYKTISKYSIILIGILLLVNTTLNFINYINTQKNNVINIASKKKS